MHKIKKMACVQLGEDVRAETLWEIINNFDESVINAEEKRLVSYLLGIEKTEVYFVSRRVSRKKCLFHILHAYDIFLVRKEK